MRQHSTTIPSAETDHRSIGDRPTAIRWVSPGRVTMPLSASWKVVGRDPSCAVALDGGEISRKHAEFRIDGPIAVIRDLESRNGSFVNGVRCADGAIAIGDVVRCGEWIGVSVCEAEGSDADFGAITPGWFGGAVLKAAVAPARRIAGDLPIVIQGETGTGKEGMARAIHAWSGRGGPLVAVNCAALPSELVEAELFGYRKGAFTGANANSPGLFRAAEGGTIFLDEILDLPSALQPKLLRVLEEKQVRALGETRDVPVDVRVIAATQEPLASAVAERRFRADLHARLDGLTVVLPPLRARREDVAPLFFEFLRMETLRGFPNPPAMDNAGRSPAPSTRSSHTGARPPEVEARLVETLCLYDWPLNVRELALLTRQLVGVHGHEPLLKKSFLPARLLVSRPGAATEMGEGRSATPAVGSRRPRVATSDETEFESLIQALREHGGSVARAAAAIGVSRARAYRLLSAHPDFSLDDIRGD